MDTASSNKKTDVSQDVSTEHAQRDVLKAIFYCLLVVVFIRSFIIEPFRIPSSSMVPTLRIGDHIFVSKFSYGLSIPFTKFEFLSLSQPKRGDVVVFLWPRDESLHYVKRIIGLPGDKIEIKDKGIWINDKAILKEPVSPERLKENILEPENDDGQYFIEKLENRPHFIRHFPNSPFGHETRNILEVVPPNHYFVMGDNRDDSSDSRSWGFVPRQNIKGKAQLIWLSLDQVGAWNNLKKIRWARCAQAIH
jgi:signal peptidase I